MITKYSNLTLKELADELRARYFSNSIDDDLIEEVLNRLDAIIDAEE